MTRLPQIVLLASLLPLCWLGMTAAHELGHVLGAWGTKGAVSRVVIHPLAISRTDVDPNPQPFIVAWSGPLAGVVLPLLMWVALRRWRAAFLFRFFAGFCCVANGSYLGLGSFGGIGDAGTLLQSGAPVWTLWLFGAVTVPIGFVLWNGQGKSFGLGEAEGAVDERIAYGVLVVTVLAVSSAVIFSSAVE